MDNQIRCMLVRIIAFVFVIGIVGLSNNLLAHAEDTETYAIEISGTVIDAETGTPLPGVNVTVSGRVIGVATGSDGTFSLNVSGEPPITLVISLVGYQRQEIEITQSLVSGLVIELEEQAILGGDVVVSASRVEQSILEAPVTIERMDVIAINQTASDTYYKALANLKGVDVTTSSINFQIINSRGFNSTGNTRMVQLIDGMDTQAPALNFPIGNLNGPSELDIESVEFLPGASSALYGPNAFNGILLINSKSPFQYQGLSATVKTGFNHIDGNTALGEPDSPQNMFDASIRWADAPTDRFAYKVNFSYSQAEDWYGINFTDKNAALQGDLSVNPAYDGIHLFGDDGSFNIGLLAINEEVRNTLASQLTAQTGVPLSETAQYVASIPSQPVNRTGYQERYLVDYNAKNLKFNTSLHYRVTDNAELSYSLNYGSGTSIYTGAQRYSLKDFYIHQHKVELTGDNFMLRGYGTFENSGDSYIADFVGFAINDAYLSNQNWFGTYGATFAGGLMMTAAEAQGGDPTFNPATVQAILNNPGAVSQFHMAARQSADANRYEPGSAAFDAAKEATLEQRVPDGALFDDKSRFLHFEGQYDFKNEIDVVDLQAGASFRQFQLRSNGTIFDDPDGRNINEFGGYLQASRALGDLRLTGSVRYDKNENFDGQFSPRISAVYGVAPSHNLRASYQTGFRNPTTQGQYIDLNVINARLLGGLPYLAERYRITEDSYTMESVQQFTDQFLANPNDPLTAIGMLERYSVHNPVKPEQIQAFEIGYKGLFNNRVMVDAAYYYNIYDDFITQIRVRRAAAPIPSQEGVASLLSGDASNTFQVYTNIDNTVTAHGAVIGLDFSLPNYYRFGVNYNYNALIDGLEDQFVNDFNTPEHKFNISFGNRRITDNLGFNVTYRWQDAFRWESSFAMADIDAVSTLDVQVSYRIPDLNTVVKFGGTNILNQQYTLSGGGPNLGSIFYLSVTYDQLFR
jgi:iron complex outermembrane recepter protein